MVDVKEAVAAAVVFMKHVMEPSRATDLLLEEVELARADRRQVWRVTISMPKPVAFRDVVSGARDRDYKTFTVDAETGQVKSMRIRELAEAR
jgi:hypothetical protein